MAGPNRLFLQSFGSLKDPYWILRQASLHKGQKVSAVAPLVEGFEVMLQTQGRITTVQGTTHLADDGPAGPAPGSTYRCTVYAGFDMVRHA